MKVTIMKVNHPEAVGVCRAIKTLLLIGAVALACGSSTNAAISTGTVSISPTNLAIVEGSVITLSATFYESAAMVSYTGIVTWTDGAISTNVATVPATNNITVSATHQYANVIASPFSISVAVSSTNGENQTESLAGLTVVDAPLSVVFAGPVTNLTEGVLASNVTILTFLDANSLASTGQYSSAPSGIVLSNSSTFSGTYSISNAGPSSGGVLFNVNATGKWSEEGSNSVQITVTDNGGSSLIATSAVFVADAGLAIVSIGNLSFTEGVATNETLLTFLDNNTLASSASLADYVAVVLWGDGTSSAFSNNAVVGSTTVDSVSAGSISVQNVATNLFKVVGDHAYYSNGTYSVTIQVNDRGGAPAIIVSGETNAVADAGLKVTAVNTPDLTALPGFESLEQVTSNPLGDWVIAFIDTNEFSGYPPINVAPYTEYLAMINWGDGTPNTAGVVTNIMAVDAGTATFRVYGNHTYSAICTQYTLSVLVQDINDTAMCAATQTVSVLAAPIKEHSYDIAAAANNTFSGVVAAFTDPNSALSASSFTATIDWSDGTLPTTGTIVAFGGGSYLVEGTHTYVSPTPTEYVRVTIDDTVDVCAIPQVITSTIEFVEGISITPVATTTFVITGVSFTTNVVMFTDSGLPAGMSSDLSAVINWGDGTASAGTITTNAAGQYVVSGTHTYLDDGRYSVYAIITDSSAPEDAVTASNADNPSIFVSESAYTDLTSSMEVLFSNLKIMHFKSAGKSEPEDYYYSEQVTLKNISGGTITGPFGLVLQRDLFPANNMQLLNITGQLPDGREYVPLSVDTLKAKGKIKVTLQWSDQLTHGKGPVILPVRLIAGPGL
jgi:hypothetical protein